MQTDEDLSISQPTSLAQEYLPDATQSVPLTKASTKRRLNWGVTCIVGGFILNAAAINTANPVGTIPTTATLCAIAVGSLAIILGILVQVSRFLPRR